MAIRIELSERTNQATGAVIPLVTLYRGKRKRGEAYRFRSALHRSEWIRQQEESDAASMRLKVEMKALAKANTLEMRAKIQVGSILVNSWGYDQTNVDAYQVVAKTKSGATVTLRQIGTATQGENGGFMSDRVKPLADYFLEDTKAFTKRINACGVSFNHGSASLHEGGRDYYRSWYA